ncbi:MAG: thiamine-phosphate kinase [Bacteroidales bacterium]|jgi:thiamine-monophosphate kinase|nr:thiamine-phosphate kinase [Bacteroidales bacterium]
MSDNKNKRTPISELGEFGLIDRITGNFNTKNSETILGVGDDAAIIGSDSKMVVTTDILTEGIHFDLVYTPLRHLGYKSVVVNLSDVYAMNATPKQITVSIAISSRFAIEDVEELYSGIKMACDLYNVDLIGGDTTSSLTGLTISVTAIGTANEDKIVKRSGAQKNNLICVTGDLGGAYMGLQLLEREKSLHDKQYNQQPELGGYEYILERQLKPEARKDIIEELAKADITPTSMIDISDGLSSELMHICKNSETGCHIYMEKIPVNDQTADMAKEFNIDPLVAALNGGEDYELLFTVDIKDYDKVVNIPGVTVIGHVCENKDEKVLVTPDDTTIELKAQGWNHAN